MKKKTSSSIKIIENHTCSSKIIFVVVVFLVFSCFCFIQFNADLKNMKTWNFRDVARTDAQETFSGAPLSGSSS